MWSSRRDPARPPRIVEGVDQRRVAPIGFGRADILDPVALPQPVGPAESRDPAFGRDSGASQDHEIANVGHQT